MEQFVNNGVAFAPLAELSSEVIEVGAITIMRFSQ
jgi:hypothetical protein